MAEGSGRGRQWARSSTHRQRQRHFGMEWGSEMDGGNYFGMRLQRPRWTHGDQKVDGERIVEDERNVFVSVHWVAMLHRRCSSQNHSPNLFDRQWRRERRRAEGTDVAVTVDVTVDDVADRRYSAEWWQFVLLSE